jgi:tetratricopeptide (TPR) repeat protein
LFVLPGLVVLSRPREMAEGSPRTRRPIGWRKLAFGLVPLLVVAGLVLWRPVVAVAYANVGAVQQAKADLANLSAEAGETSLALARHNYERVLELDPHNRTANLRLGNLAVDGYHYEEGLTYLETVWQASPRDPTARKALGLACVWVGQTQRAAELLNETPNIVAELNTWGWWHQEQGHHLSAMRAYQTSLLLYPDQPEVRGLLASWQSQ